jgi:hypothetical protein
MNKGFPITEKRCRHCGETKPISEFYSGYTTSDGHGSWCKKCVYSASSIHNAIKYDEDPEYRTRHISRVVERAKERKTTDSEFRKRQNKYTADSRKKRKESDPEYYEASKAKVNARYKKRMQNPVYRIIRAAWMNVVNNRRRARQAGNGGSHTAKEWEKVKQNPAGFTSSTN